MQSRSDAGSTARFEANGPDDMASELSAWENEGGAPPSAWVEGRILSAARADEEERIRCRLGSSVIARWSALPASVQRGLFQQATSVDALCDSIKLKVQIARFLHDHAG